ncbi:ATP-grasp domain-containing protein [Lignipirellula cremea]|uniref:ATP-grasp domain protein n=1 Tax=Lignipirellula cremea TaxID=2528010 RepID=A0A518DXB6_9BACT|nr:ATP-grasp domain-containing protein [Lignipirellula cremea]QDU96467.1 ATP-grasp domain protein [Lignipirellula cremea]
MQPPLLILGASARAAAQSALRGGFRPFALDMFGDADLQACCPAVRVANYPQGLEYAACQAPESPFLYTGGLENHPQLIARLAHHRQLLGNSASVLRAVRRPENWTNALRKAGLPCLLVQSEAPVHRPEAWLSKPLRSAGGMHITPAACDSAAAGRYFQEYRDGQPHSGLYVAAGGRARLLGVTRQLIGETWTGGSGYAYCGSIGPLPLTTLQEAAWRRLGDCLVDSFPLAGLFGIDAVVDAQAIWPVEVNPRFPASAELYDRAHGASAVRLHVQACLDQSIEGPDAPPRTARQMQGKAILWALSDLTISDAWTQQALLHHISDERLLADIPAAGQTIRTGEPIVTCFASGATVDEVTTALKSRAAAVRASL